MATANLHNDGVQVEHANDSIVIVDNLQSIRGGRTLDVSGFTPEVVRAGHVIIQQTSNKEYKPMPVNVTGKITSLGAITPGSGYTNNGTYTAVALTGGSGSGATANIVVAGNAVTSVTIVNPGSGFKAGDVLSAAAANIGTSGSGFSVGVASMDSSSSSYASLPADHTYAGILIASVLTKKAFAGILVRGTVNPAVAPYSMTSILAAVKTALPLVDFRED